MRNAAINGGVFHLWWHPHNFGLHPEENFAVLKAVLDENSRLRDLYNLKSLNMHDFVMESLFTSESHCNGYS
jgi:hypothetical protein